MNVFCQLSKIGMDEKLETPIEMVSIRNALQEGAPNEWGNEGASNLFYYLFDDWRAVYQAMETFQDRLKALVWTSISTGWKIFTNPE